MNVLNIPKQCDHELIYTSHAINRAKERGVPLPKYVPFGSILEDVVKGEQSTKFKIVYTYNDIRYIMVVTSEKSVLTVFPAYPLTQSYKMRFMTNNYRSTLTAKFIASDKFIYLDYETDYSLYQQYS